MKKRTVLIFIIVALITGMLATPAAAAGGKLTLLSAKISQGESVFAFKVEGNFGKFDGTAYFSGDAYPLVCKLRQDAPDILLCRGNKVLGGNTVQVVVNGRSWTTLVVNGPRYCTPVYDWPGLSDGPWLYYGDHCTEEVPQRGDWTDHFSFDYAWKYYRNQGGFCGPDGSWNDYGPGFYYPNCYGGS